MELNDIFSLLLVMSFMWYICYGNKNKHNKETFIVNNTSFL